MAQMKRSCANAGGHASVRTRYCSRSAHSAGLLSDTSDNHPDPIEFIVKGYSHNA